MLGQTKVAQQGKQLVGNFCFSSQVWREGILFRAKKKILFFDFF